MTEPAERPRQGGLTTDKVTTSSRDAAALGPRLGAWLATRLPADADPEVTEVVKPDGNGMSSETLLFSAMWTDDDGRTERRLVARIEPETDDVPIFPTYDLGQQHRVMALVAEATTVPVPAPLWAEDDPAVLGAPFFVMERLDGDVPRDVLPYTFPDDNFVIAATDDQRTRLMRSAVAALAGIHALDPAHHDLDFLAYPMPGATDLDRHLAYWEAYKDWVTADEPSPLLDRCFAWLHDHRPTDLGEPRLSWGDARIGNMMFVDFEVSAVLDWEMAGVAPPEIDVGWMAYLHRFFQDITTDLGEPGLPDFLTPRDLAATYTEVSGRPLGDLRWPMAYAAMRHGIIMRRVLERSVHFGEADKPDDIDDLIMHRATLESMLDNTYWDHIPR